MPRFQEKLFDEDLFSDDNMDAGDNEVCGTYPQQLVSLGNSSEKVQSRHGQPIFFADTYSLQYGSVNPQMKDQGIVNRVIPDNGFTQSDTVSKAPEQHSPFF